MMLAVATAAAVLGFSVDGLATGAEAAEQPNFLVLFGDDWWVGQA